MKLVDTSDLTVRFGNQTANNNGPFNLLNITLLQVSLILVSLINVNNRIEHKGLKKFIGQRGKAIDLTLFVDI